MTYTYDAWGKFLNADGAISEISGEMPGCNMYAYCMNHPVNMSDSTGNWPKPVKNAVKWATKNVFKSTTQIAKS